MKLLKFLVLAIAVLFINNSYGDDTAQLNQLLQSFQSMQANFTQTITDSSGTNINSSGTLFIQKPNQFRWEVTTPNEQIFISNGQKLWNVEPDLQQVTISKLTQNLSTTPLLLLSGNVSDINKLFNIQAQANNQYQLTPLDQDDLIKQVTLKFTQQTIQSITIINTMGQTATITFSNVKLNTPIDPSNFNYQPTADMQVLQQ